MVDRRAAPMSGGGGGDGGLESAATSRISDATSVSDAGAPFSSVVVGGGARVLMEGVLKKRGASLPVMRERYCVATRDGDGVLLRSYKSHKSFVRSPEKPAGAHVLKCFGEWDGRGNFHRYDHAFLMETSDSKVFFCAAPTADDKRRWIDVMNSAVMLVPVGLANLNSSSSSSGTGGDAANGRPSVAKRQSSRAPNAVALSEHSLFEAESDEGSDGGDDQATDSEQSPDDGLFRSSSGADSALLSDSDRGGASKAEPADWGIFGGDGDVGPSVSRYDVVDRPVLLLDDELLNEPSGKSALASDAFLFEDVGPSRFGTVVVKNTVGASDDDLADFVDQELAARLEREKSEKKLKQRAQKLESNRDLYAEMAAARLNSMRKDARHPTKKSPRELSFRPSQYVGEASEYNESEDGYSHMTESGYDRNSAEADDLFAKSEVSSSRRSAAEDPRSIAVRASEHREDAQLDVADDAVEVEQEPKKKKRERKAAEDQLVQFNSEQPSEELAVAPAPSPVDDHVSEGSDTEDVERQEEERRLAKERRREERRARKEKLRQEDEEAAAFAAAELARQEQIQQQQQDEEEEQRREKERRREERRARKERQRQEEDEAAALAAAELARQHRDAMREREEEKARKREKKERRERRDRVKVEKEKKHRKAKEAELQAEVERLRFAQLQQKADDEKKEKKKKRRDKEKYSTPTERILRMEKEVEAHAVAADMSNALVLVETPAPTPAPAPVAPASAPAPALASTSIGPVSPPTAAVNPDPAAAPQPPYSTPIGVPAPLPVTTPQAQAAASSSDPYASESSAIPQAPQSQPTYPVVPQYIPGYPAPPQSLPLYAPPPPFGAYQYPSQPYYPAQFASMGYGAMQAPYFQSPPPSFGYAPSPMMSAPYPGAYPEMASFASGPPTSGAATTREEEEQAFIGPQLPSPKAQQQQQQQHQEAFLASRSASIGPPPPPLNISVASNSISRSSGGGVAPHSTSPALPDLPDLPDIADF